MKQTAFTPFHRELGAKLVEFAGFEMPLLYAGIHEEHRAVRTGVGVFDVSHMGEFSITGPDALALVQHVTTNDASRLVPGKAQYSSMCYPDGGIVDDLLVYRLAEGFMLVVNAANIGKDLEWIRSQSGGLNAAIDDRSDATSLLAVQGPRSLDTLRKLVPGGLDALPYYGFARGTLCGHPAIISRTGYTGELGFELYFDASPSVGRDIWTAIMDAGSEFGIQAVGLGARDTLRLEMGFCLYGNDIDQTTNPLESGLGWITRLDKGRFVGREALLKIRESGVRRKLTGFVVEDGRAFPRHGYEIHVDGKPGGHVTSGTISPTLGRGIGLGFVPSGAAQEGTKIGILIRDREFPSRIERPPFIRKPATTGSEHA